jgi:hypothetical protein
VTNADLCVEEEIEVHPVNQNRNQQKSLLEADSSESINHVTGVAIKKKLQI